MRLKDLREYEEIVVDNLFGIVIDQVRLILNGCPLVCGEGQQSDDRK